MAAAHAGAGKAARRDRIPASRVVDSPSSPSVHDTMSPSMMPATHTRLRLRRPVRLLPAFAVALCSVLWGGVSSAAVPERVRGVPGSHEFRLGSGAAPFGWSTAIGDFDVDGEPDVAVVDSVGRGARGYHYRIEFLVSSTGRYAAAFESPHRALLVTAQDVDRDRHLDLVVTSVLRHEVVGIWLNDGTGRFEQADLPRGPPILPSSSRLSSPRGAASWVSTLAPGWRAPLVHLTAGLVVRVEPRCARLRPSAVRGRCFFLRRALVPRAPPARLL
jgi:hypothetical protein